ncbi:MAG: phosphate ABC transporter permease PstA [Acidimicrobiia bacterium]|nr:phosphate ABC transporter permease PstA [Acidimicrobiia bacterium]
MISRTAPTPDLVQAALAGRRFRLVDSLLAGGLLLSLFSSLLVLITLLADTLRTAAPVFADRGLVFVTAPLSADPAKAGVLQGIQGSLALTLFVMLIGFPLGVSAAIYLEEYATDGGFTRFITANVRNLAGVPSVVYGILGLALFVNLAGGLTNGRTIVSGGLTLTVLVLPIMIITTSEALRSVPATVREASYGVGATKWETIRHHVLPIALPTILTGTVLTVARAFGESAPLLLAGALVTNFFQPSADASVVQLITDERYTALPLVVFNWARQPQEEFVQLTAAAVVVLLVLLVSVNATTILLRDRFEMKSLR